MTTRVTSEDVLAALQEIAPEIDASILIENTNFRDQYEIDSIDFLRFVLILENKAAIKIPETDYPKLSSLAGCITYFSHLGRT